MRSFKYIILSIIILTSENSTAQILSPTADSCSYVISGTVINANTNLPVIGAILYLKDLNISTLSNRTGYYEFSNLCKSNYLLIVSAVNFEADSISISLEKNLRENFEMIPTSFTTERIDVNAPEVEMADPIPSEMIQGDKFMKTMGESLGESLKDVTGVTTLNTGSSISKPVIHGLYGNRILILNNGVRQEGQQWGSEHAPEIDPLIGRRLEVVKGASTVRYGPDAIAGVILVDPEILPYGKDPVGEMDVIGFSNGLEGVISGIAESGFKNMPSLSFRVQGTLKKAGNMSTPDYTLKNTGYEEANYSLTGGYRKNNFGIEGFFSSFNSKIGIFSGSHIGNLTDLENAFKRAVPFDTGSFSYQIDRPYQDISHNLVKVGGFYMPDSKIIINADYAFQKNERSEFDSHTRGSDPSIPELFFSISTNTLDLKSDIQFSEDMSASAGINGITQANIGAGRPFIPNFENYGIGAFYIHRKKFNKLLLEAGIRYDYKWQRIYKYQNGVLISPSSEYGNASGKIGLIYKFDNKLSVSISGGSAWRPPSVSELYSNGLHHGSASIEIGDPNLTSENAINITGTINYDNSRNFNAELSLYTNQISNFIYLEPRLPPTLTIRGAFPTYYYRQGDVYLNGIDLDLYYSPVKYLGLVSKSSILRAFNKTLDDYLPLIPPDRFENGINVIPGSAGIFENIQIGLTIVSVLEQTRVSKNADYVPPPEGYSLLNASLSTEFNFLGAHVNLHLTGTNILNKSYRDYMNRFRYYTDDMGRNISLKLVFPLKLK